MGMFERYGVRSLVGRARRSRTTFLLLGAATTIVLVGYAWSRPHMAAVTAADPPGAASTLQQPPSEGAGLLGRRVADDGVSYVAPDPLVLDAFFSAATTGSGGPMYVPAEVPTGSRLVPRPPPLADSGDAAVRHGPTVVLSAQGGYIVFYDALDESLTHLPGSPCGTVGGRPAVARRVLGGESVLWEDDGLLHGVFAWGLPRSVVVRVARGMHYLNAADHAGQIGVSRRGLRRIEE